MDIRITLHNLPPTHLAPAVVEDAMRRTLGAGVVEIVENVADEARQRTPVGVSGILRASIGTRVDPAPSAAVLVQGTVFTGREAPHAEPVEYGTRPGRWVPIGPLKLWARRVLGEEQAAYAVRWAIHRRGTRGRFMFRDALAAVTPRIGGIMQRAADRLAALLK